VSHRWSILPAGLRHGPWRDSRDEAVEDAIAEGLASRDEHVPENVYFDELVVIEEERS
jgi:hypothetical protein